MITSPVRRTNMQIKAFSDKILLPTREDALRVHLYLKLTQHGIKPFKHDMDIILELYKFGGYSNSQVQDEFFQSCLQKKFKKSKQSIRNTLSKYIELGVFEKPKNTTLFVSEKFIPNVKFDRLILQHTVSHAE